MNDLEIMASRIMKRRVNHLEDIVEEYGYVDASYVIDSSFDGGIDFSLAKEISHLKGKGFDTLMDDYIENHEKFEKESLRLLEQFVRENKEVMDKTVAEVRQHPFYPYCEYEAVRVEKEHLYEKENLPKLMEECLTFTADKLLTNELQEGNDFSKGKFANIIRDCQKAYDAVQRLYEQSEMSLANRKDESLQVSKSIQRYLDYELKDGRGETGGVSFRGETVKDFLESIGDKEANAIKTLKDLNQALKECGIAPIRSLKKENAKKANENINDFSK